MTLLLAAALSLSSPSNYIYTTVTHTNAILGVGMGRHGDYSLPRLEDTAFIAEAVFEREHFDLPYYRENLRYDTLIPEFQDVRVPLQELNAIIKGVPFSGDEGCLHLSEAGARLRTNADTIITNAEYRLVDIKRYVSAAVPTNAIGLGLIQISTNSNRLVLSPAPPHSLAKTNLQYHCYENLYRMDHYVSDKMNLHDSEARRTIGSNTDRLVWYYYPYPEGGGEWEAVTNRTSDTTTGTRDIDLYGQIVVNRQATIYHNTDSGFNYDHEFVGSKQGHDYSLSPLYYDLSAGFTYALTNQTITPVAAWGIFEYNRLYIERIYGQAQTSSNKYAVVILPLQSIKTADNKLECPIPETLEGRVLNLVGDPPVTVDLLKNGLDWPQPSTDYRTSSVSNFRQQFSIVRLYGIISLIKVNWRSRELD